MEIKEVELIVFSIKRNDDSLLYMKFYKTGTIIRQGVAAAPPVQSSGIGFNKDKKYFRTLISLIPGNLLDRPLAHEDNIVNDKVEYVIAFYAASDNGFTEEQAHWTKSTGVRFLLDSKSSTGNEVLSFVEQFTMQAVALTDEWYFDIMMKGHFDMQSPLLTKNDVITVPKAKEEKERDYQNYIAQSVSKINGDWTVQPYLDGKVYLGADQKQYAPRIDTSTGNFRILFFPKELSGLQMNFPIAKKPKRKKANIDKPKAKTPQPEPIEKTKVVISAKPEVRITKKWWEFWK
ncbi:hypothetical protein [Maribacter polysiphoniae]|uniref:hypothetical protein n=1 Tax=Maribacter polysiphoniae TaxID=429344 RepID=UPI002354930D|nr:hypothetical protein [Maribacter polysiphoniae]